MVRLYFRRSQSAGSRLIRFFTWSKWSHVAIEDGDHVIESVWPGGVVRTPLSEWKKAGEWASSSLVGEQLIVDLAASQVGKPYDLTAIFGILFQRDWQVTDHWFCSELIAWAFDRAGTPIFRAEALGRITPEHLWILHDQ